MRARRPWAWPLVPVYRGVLAAKEGLRKLGMFQEKKLQWPVVSVGSLSAGGAGKTPVVIALAKMLGARGWKVDVLSRGYRRKGRLTQRVSDNQRNAAREFGDEPVMMARAAKVSVWVGASRYEAGMAAEQGVPPGGPAVHLLDDGFQHRQLARKVDLVLVTAEDLRDALLPAGNLREGLGGLQRADVVVIRESERQAVEARLRGLMRSGALLWSVHRKLRFPAPLGVLSAGLRPVAFCAIARPEGFAEMLLDAGCGVVETVAFADHHAFEMTDALHVVEIARGLNATGLVTTEKDKVKLTRELQEVLESVGPLVVVELEAVFVYPERVARELEGRLG